MRETCEQCGQARARTWLLGVPPTKVRVCSICMLRALEAMEAAATEPCPSLSPYGGPCFGKDGHAGDHEDPGGTWPNTEGR